MSATTAPPRAPLRDPRPRRRAGERPNAPLLSAPLARLLALGALAGFAAVRWGTLVEPAGTTRMLALVLLALAAGFAVAQLGRLPAVAQAPGAVLVILAWAAIAAPIAGVPASLVVWPGNWDALFLGLQQGIEQLPRVLVPYAQPDAWPRIAILLGGGLLLVLGCVLGLTPGRRGVPWQGGAPFGGGIGLRLAAAAPLIAVAITPVAIVEPAHAALEGALLFALLAAFLWLEQLPRAALPAAGLIVLAAGIGGVLLERSLDRPEPWVDVQELVEGLDRPAPASFDWSQSYGPLDWPRDGREVLRISARDASYWKAQNLDAFDGVGWIRSAPPRLLAPEAEVPAVARAVRAWRQPVAVTVRSFSSVDVIGAGTTVDFEREPLAFTPASSPGTWTSAEPLGPGDGYVANTIEPRPTQRQLRTAGTAYPLEIQRYRYVGLPRRDAAAPRRWSGGGPVVVPAPFGTAPDAQGQAAEQLLAEGPYARAHALAQELTAGATTPYAYAQRVLAHLRAGYAYSETPPRRQLPLDAFLFRDRVGYCQQFAGAAALLLRMGGVPTRVSAGFTSGTRDEARSEFVVRDFDAHAWIEVWFPDIGWKRLDPTPSSAPARSGTPPPSRPAESAPAPALPRLPDAPAGEAAPTPAERGASTSDDGGGTLTPLLLGAAVLVLAAAVALAAVLTRPLAGADALLDELRRALRRTGRPPPAQLTLLQLERRFHDSADAAAYVRALRLSRYGGAAATVTAAQRRAVRAELARGLGAGGRLRALFALPPRRTR